MEMGNGSEMGMVRLLSCVSIGDNFVILARAGGGRPMASVATHRQQ